MILLARERQQGLKPDDERQAIAARLKSCPDYKTHFRRLFSGSPKAASIQKQGYCRTLISFERDFLLWRLNESSAARPMAPVSENALNALC
jgi:hypothetical protein